MRLIAVPILILLMMTQTFSQWFVLAAFKINQAYIAKNLCVNRYRPELHCNGNCILMKKRKQREKEEQNSPSSLKLEVSTVIVSSRSFFCDVNTISLAVDKPTIPVYNTGSPVDRSFTVFHPPKS